MITRKLIRNQRAPLALFLALVSATPAVACTRILYTSEQGTVITARGMDWAEDMNSNLWVFPRGITRQGLGTAQTISWKSKYGSLIVSGYDVGTADGVNERGLVANVLYLSESHYGGADGRPTISISLWAQYVLDLFATVDEAVTALSREPFRIEAPRLPNGQGAQLHLSLSDATGDSAILEYIDGKLVIHHGRQYTVMTNSPSYDQQLALNAYWRQVGGLKFLPGTNQAADRFVRASFLLEAIPREPDPRYLRGVPGQKFEFQAIASTLSVLRSVGVPLGITTPGQPNISSTIWRTVVDHRNRVLLFDSVTAPNVFWVSLDKLNLQEGAPVKKLLVAGGHVHSGEAADKFEEATPFEFLPATGPKAR
jgi:penicillin V acylase-like amidase (Ntn superfamily)